MESNFLIQVVFPIVTIILQVIIGAVLAAMGFFIKRYFQQQDEENRKQDAKIEKVRDELHSLAASLPHAYVLREDWIRNMVTLDHKMESVRKGIDGLRRDSMEGIDGLRQFMIGAINDLRKDFKGVPQ